ncbi:MAG: hypothetical protein DHS20C18_41120 [Saprospiraceae bacterium]|nr:MAG: hypothetical protein DHS20C18_41120 [Saprospiraceae bacterium]
MHPKTKQAYLTLIFCIASLFAVAQTNEARTISVTGSATTNVSPNEIIIEVRYEEYFNGEEQEANRVTIEKIEEKVLTALGKAKIKDEKITLGGINVIRPSIYKNNERIDLKRRLSKALFICVETTDQLLKVVRQLEAAQLMDEVITTFEIVETRHTDVEEFKKQVKIDAFKDAWSKANLILSTSNQKPGAVLTVKESPQQPTNGMEIFGSTYDVVASPASRISGFKPILVSCNIEVVFSIE